MKARILTVPADQYHADHVDDRPTLSASIAKTLLNQSPAHAAANHPRLNPAFRREEEPRFDLGRASHSLFLEGDANVAVFTYDTWQSKAAKEARAEARAHGKTPMLGKHWDECQAMVHALETQLAGLITDPPMFAGGTPEKTVVWEEDGVVCRARLDYLHDNFAAIDDYKTTSASAKPKTWSDRTMYGIGGDVQAAFYLRGLRAVTGADAVFRFLIQETYAPYALSVVEISPAVLTLGDAKVDRAIQLWRSCLETGVWPAYPRVAHRAELPAWEESRFLDAEARDEELAA